MTNRILSDRAKSVLKLSNEERIEALIQETVFVHPAFENVHRKLEKLLKHSPSQTTRHLMLIGDTGLGKSTILNTFASEYGLFENLDHPEGPRVELPVLYLPIPADTTLRKLELFMADKLNASLLRRPSKDEVTLEISRKITEFNVRMIVLDEIQHINAAQNSREWSALKDFIKDIANRHHIPVVIGGLPEIALRLVSTDAQLKRRFFGNVIRLSPWKRSAGLRDLLEEIEETLPLRKRSNLNSEAMMEIIEKSTSGSIDEIYFCIRLAAEEAIRTGKERITPKQFSEIRKSLNLPFILEPGIADDSRGGHGAKAS